MGDICTRGCAFCNISTGRPDKLDRFEPLRVARSVERLNLRHVVITSVDRDDLNDGGAEHISNTVKLIKKYSPRTSIEILTPDFLHADKGSIEQVIDYNLMYLITILKQSHLNISLYDLVRDIILHYAFCKQLRRGINIYLLSLD